MKVFITGGGGFIGSHLVDSQLAQGYQVRVLDLHADNLNHAVTHPNLELVRGNLLDPTLIRRLVKGIDVLYHLASAHLDVRLSKAAYQQVNVEATVRLLEAAQAAGVKRVVHCSSNGVLGELTQLPADETTPCRPTNIYEQTKLAGEQAALGFAQATDLPVVVVRPTWVYGPRCPRTQKLFRTIGKGRFLLFGDGRTLRHPIYIADAVRGLELCAAHRAGTGEVYFIGGPAPVTIQTLVATIAQVQGVHPPSIHLPVILGKGVGYTLQWLCKPLGKQPPFSRRSLDFFLKDNAYAIGKAQRDLGFQPQVDLRAGLVQTYAWLKQQRH